MSLTAYRNKGGMKEARALMRGAGQRGETPHPRDTQPRPGGPGCLSLTAYRNKGYAEPRIPSTGGMRESGTEKRRRSRQRRDRDGITRHPSRATLRDGYAFALD